MRVTLLDLDQMPLIKALIEKRDGTLSVNQEEQGLHRIFTLLSVEDLIKCGPSTGQVFGAWNESETELTGILTTAVSQAQPCFFIRKAYTSPEAPLSTLASMFAAAIESYESKGYNRFYTMYRTKDIGLYHRLWRTASTLKNYITYTDLMIAPNLRPKHSDYWELLFGRTLYSDEMAIRAFIRKDETMFFNEDFK